MQNAVKKLSEWMIDRAEQAELTLDQCKALTLHQVRKNLPVEYRSGLTQVIFQKAKSILVRSKYQSALDELKQNSNIRQEILSVFPDASFEVNISKKKIVIYLEGNS